MFIKYQDATGNLIEIEVSEVIGEVSIEIDKEMANSNRRETRWHNSISRMEEAGVQFADESIDVAELLLENEANRKLRAAMNKLLPQQKELIRQVFFEERSLVEIARETGVTVGAVWNRLQKIYKRLKFFLE